MAKEDTLAALAGVTQAIHAAITQAKYAAVQAEHIRGPRTKGAAVQKNQPDHGEGVSLHS